MSDSDDDYFRGILQGVQEREAAREEESEAEAQRSAGREAERQGRALLLHPQAEDEGREEEGEGGGGVNLGEMPPPPPAGPPAVLLQLPAAAPRGVPPGHQDPPQPVPQLGAGDAGESPQAQHQVGVAGETPGGEVHPMGEPGTDGTRRTDPPTPPMARHEFSRPVTFLVEGQAGEGELSEVRDGVEVLVLMKLRGWRELPSSLQHLRGRIGQRKTIHSDILPSGRWVDLPAVFDKRGRRIRRVWIEPQVIPAGQALAEDYRNTNLLPTRSRAKEPGFISMSRVVAVMRSGAGPFDDTSETVEFQHQGRQMFADVLLVAQTNQMMLQLFGGIKASMSRGVQYKVLSDPAPSGSERHSRYVVLKNEDHNLSVGIRQMAYTEPFVSQLNLGRFSALQVPPLNNSLKSDYLSSNVTWRRQELEKVEKFATAIVGFMEDGKLSFTACESVVHYAFGEELDPMCEIEHELRGQPNVDNREGSAVRSSSAARDVSAGKIRLVSREGDFVLLNVGAEVHSVMLDALELDNEEDHNEVQLNIDRDVLEVIRDFLHLRSGNAEAWPIDAPLRTATLHELIRPREVYLVLVENRSMSFLIKLFAAAHYMLIDGLTEMACAAIASKLKGGSVATIMEAFGFGDEVFTDEAKERIVAQNEWCRRARVNMNANHRAWREHLEDTSRRFYGEDA